MSTRSGLVRISTTGSSPPKTRKGASPSRSPARTRRSSPPSLSSSNKSPSRKSPSRKSVSKFPARKSPSRATKEGTETSAPKSPVKRPVIRDVEIKLQQNTTITEITKGVRARRSDYSIKDLSSNISENNKYVADKVNGIDSVYSSKEIYSIRHRQPLEEVVPRRSSRLRDIIDNVPDTRRSLSNKSVTKSYSKSGSKSLDAVSDQESSEEDLEKEHTKSVTRKLATPLRDGVTKLPQISRWEFGGRIGSFFLIFLMPLTVFLIIISCKTTCSIKSHLDLTAYKYLSTWFSPQALVLISGQYLIQAMFALLPLFGTVADRMDDSGIKYCFNAFFSSIFTVLTLFCLDLTGIFKSETLLNDYLRLTTISYIYAVILSIIVYVRSSKVSTSDLNTYAKTGFVSYDFWMGREIHPHFKSLNIKIWTSRISNISTLILAILIFKQGFTISKDIGSMSLQDYKQIVTKVKINPALLLYSMMQITYILNFIMREYKITSTFYWQSEGVGYLQIVSSALYPYYFTTMSKFVADYKLSLETNILIISLVLFMLGFFLMLISNNIKYEFRNNPLQPAFSRIETMPTFHGKKLLISGIWGILRHPNYTGDILVHIALALPGIWSGRLIAALPAILTILMLLHRAWRDHARCGRRYGAAWQRYCKRTPSVIIPKVL